MAKPRLTDARYAEIADSCEAESPSQDEVRSIEVDPAVLRSGRPTKGAPTLGKTPVLPIRLPDTIRAELDHRVKAGESDSASELIRRAIVEYFERHPAGSG
jgi:acetylornithine deacetylase/succinyl-diaminopimelate desuccinylase-like protein